MLQQWSRKSTLVMGGIAVVILFVLLQLLNFLPPFERTNPPVTSAVEWNSPETESLVRTACYDCHSNETEWPWYSYIAPVSLLVTHDVNEGRDHMNFSTGYKVEADEIIEVLREGEMPPQVYTIMHGDAALSEEQKQTLIDGVLQTFGGAGSGQQSEDHDDD